MRSAGATAAIVAGGAALVLLVGIVVSYNRFVHQRNLIRNAWANIDTELRRRYDLIPNLVETVRGYAAHEREVLERVTQARTSAAGTQGTAAERAPAEGALVSALRGMLALAESYPDLKASQSFLELQRELAITEDRIQTSRRFYNGNVRDYNRRVQAFPSNVIASSFGFREARYFEVEAALRAEGAPSASFRTPS